MYKKYCLGFILNEELDQILLIKKDCVPKECPEMLGKLNSVGGLIEIGETPIQGMRRECLEECGLDLNFIQFCSLTRKSGVVIYCFYSITNKIYDYKQLESEPLDLYGLNSHDSSIHGHFSNPHFYKNYGRMPNIDYMLEMIKNHYLKLDKTELFEIVEK